MKLRSYQIGNKKAGTGALQYYLFYLFSSYCCRIIFATFFLNNLSFFLIQLFRALEERGIENIDVENYPCRESYEL